jgi:phospho-N-acetylmuramoyl-pentapeptide-transferase
VLIRFQRRLHMNQVQKSYGVGLDLEVKGSTPTMGGIVFILSALVAFWAEPSAQALLFWSLPVACGVIGLTDDWLKTCRKSSEGFSSPRKLTAQAAVAAIWTLWAASRRDLVLWPGVPCSYWLTLPVTLFGTVAVMNAVNVTDGLDGLAGGAFVISLGLLGALTRHSSLFMVCFAVLLGLATSFLLYNIRPARIVMGDTGAHFLGGALVALAVEGDAILALIPACFLYGVELLSSAIQIVAIRRFHRKVFKMAPLHHHFQRMGWDETTVTERFLIFHVLGAVLLAALCVQILG